MERREGDDNVYFFQVSNRGDYFILYPLVCIKYYMIKI